MFSKVGLEDRSVTLLPLTCEGTATVGVSSVGVRDVRVGGGSMLVGMQDDSLTTETEERLDQELVRWGGSGVSVYL